MASFDKGPNYRTPFGSKNFLRSTRDVKTESYTVSAASVPEETIDGATEKMLRKGEVLALITNGPEAGKVGPFQAAGTAEVQTLTKGGTWSAGTYTLTVTDPTDATEVTTAAIAYNATAATVEAALETAGVDTDAIKVTGGPLSTTALTFTYYSDEGGNMPEITADIALVTGSSPTVTAATSTAGVAGATDGRGVLANIVGINNTDLPWTLLVRDCEVAAVYECTAVQAWVTERDATGARITLTNTTADGMRGTKGLDILFK